MFTKIQNQLKSNKGFTLIELMVVISIIAILVAIALPRFAEARRAANTAKVAADLRSIDSAITMYEADTGIPPTAGVTIDASVLWAGTTTKYFASVPKPPSGGDVNYAATAGDVSEKAKVAVDAKYSLTAITNMGVRGTVPMGSPSAAATYEHFVGFKPATPATT